MGPHGPLIAFNRPLSYPYGPKYPHWPPILPWAPLGLPWASLGPPLGRIGPNICMGHNTPMGQYPHGPLTSPKSHLWALHGPLMGPHRPKYPYGPEYSFGPISPWANITMGLPWASMAPYSRDHGINSYWFLFFRPMRFFSLIC